MSEWCVKGGDVRVLFEAMFWTSSNMHTLKCREIRTPVVAFLVLFLLFAPRYPDFFLFPLPIERRLAGKLETLSLSLSSLFVDYEGMSILLSRELQMFKID